MIFKNGALHPNTPYLFADLAELLVVVGYNGRNSIHKNDLEAILGQQPVSEDELDDENEAEEGAASSAERNSRTDRQLEDVMTHLNYREGAFGDAYPFRLVDETLSVINPLTNKQRVYRALLACSRLRSFGRTGIPQRWAKIFTNISRVALCGMVPLHATVRIFDANSEDRRNYYTTDLRQALVRLGRDLRVLQVYEAECLKQNSSGDAGLDLVAIVDFDDGAANAFALLGQCGAQEIGWPKKTLEAHPLRYRNFFHMQVDHPGVMFTPVCFRTSDGEWYDNQAANGIYLADRGRILQLIGLQDRWDEIVATGWFAEFEAELATIRPPE